MYLVIAGLIALGVLLWLLLTPSGKAFHAKIKAAEEAKNAKVHQALSRLVETANSESIDEQKTQRIAQAFRTLRETKPHWVGKIRLSSKIYQDVRQVLPSILGKTSPASGLHEVALDFLSGSAVQSQEVYALALGALEMHPTESRAKQLALKMGRYHFGKLRGGNITIYDEQAIQNDIQVRSK